MNKHELRKAFKEKLITEEQYKDELFKASQVVKEKKPERIYERIKEEDFLKIIYECNKRKLNNHKIILLVAYGSGLRLQEILNLQKDDISVKERIIHIRQGKGSKD